MNPFEYYSGQLSVKETRANTLQKQINNLSTLRLLSGCVLLVIVYFAFKYDTAPFWLAVTGSFIAFLYTVKRHGGFKDKHKLVLLNIKLLKDELQAVEGNHSAFLAGKELMDASHPYSYDLDIFGDGSVFQMLCRSVTHSGYKALAQLLQSPYASAEEIAQRQAIVKELSSNPDLLQSFRITGAAGEEGVKDREHILSWMELEDSFISKPYLKIASVVVPLAAIVFFVLSIMQGTFHLGLLLVLVANWTILGIHSKDIKRNHLLVGRSAKLIDKYDSLLRVIASSDFQNEMLQRCSVAAKKSLAEIMQFRKLVNLFDSRANGMVGPLMNSFFLFDIYCLLKLEKWRAQNRQLLSAAFDYVDIFDVHASLATYAFNHPANNYPAINPEQTAIIAKDAKHPLISAKAAIGNDATIGINERFYLLTGANMTGKSTFIRTIGANLVLSYVGVPVPVAAFTVPLVRIYTAIRISDSVQDDVSYFKAELNRLQRIMHAIKDETQPYLILLDEPLRGTNSTDKQQGTRSIVERLIAHHAIGIVATHDTGLCDLEQTHYGKISNYHFESRVEQDHLGFDYKLKAGCSTSNNATVLMRLMDII
ncbi:MutS-related protein [Polluticoccus soli]|uniref:MutS-related protein n=1 Tax=Polluticoccus soli TaxID=3034150 RepID=UPI0023E19627|nr:hypothetical protein [Flavipsychrobacter sp. JY13-12]